MQKRPSTQTVRRQIHHSNSRQGRLQILCKADFLHRCRILLGETTERAPLARSHVLQSDSQILNCISRAKKTFAPESLQARWYCTAGKEGAPILAAVQRSDLRTLMPCGTVFRSNSPAAPCAELFRGDTSYWNYLKIRPAKARRSQSAKECKGSSDPPELRLRLFPPGSSERPWWP